jgi:sulfoxide reductase heme-binding subunit YedZ
MQEAKQASSSPLVAAHRGAAKSVRVAVATPRRGGGEAPGQQRGMLPRITHPRWLPALVIISGFMPLLLLAAGFASDLWRETRFLTSNPIEFMEHFTGEWNLRFLALTLAITPAMRLTGWGWLIRYRRIFGLFAFLYIAVHLGIYFGLDIELSWADLVADVADRTYITLGMLGFLLLVPLAITSTKAWVRRIGNRRWTALHRLVYVAAILGVIHYWMAVKKDISDPLAFAAIFLVLFAYRLAVLWRVSRARGERSAALAG